ncbi:MAG: histidine phosphatase family protein [Oscillospiraceae bacterium]|nr:histidine phosphatase family protein [Oscillospiraceae bacterium]
MKIIFIRHGKTQGNLRGAYIGRTDEELCLEGIAEIKSKKYPLADVVIASPMKRCLQTADIIYPDAKKIICNDLRECDFGDFEGKSYSELNGDDYYQKWIDSFGSLPFPNGEPHENFTERCCGAFERLADEYFGSDIAFVVHGGTIMAVLEGFSVEGGGFYDFGVKNGCGYIAEYSDKRLCITEHI